MSNESGAKRFWAKLVFNAVHHGRQPFPARSLAADFLSRTGLHRQVVFSREGIKLRLRKGGLARLWWANPRLRFDGICFLRAALREGDVVVDVGANIGIHSLLAARRVGKAGRVIAVEAHPATHAAFRENIRLNDFANIELHNVAAGPDRSVVRFSDRSDDDWNHVTAAGVVEVQQKPLDEITAGVPAIDFLKLDVEGYELPCLKGGGGTLVRTSHVLLEFWAEHARRFGYGLDEVRRHLVAAGFSGFVLEEESSRPRLEPLGCQGGFAELKNLVFTKDVAGLWQRLEATAVDLDLADA